MGSAVAAHRELQLVFGADRTDALYNVLITVADGFASLESKLWQNPKTPRAVVADPLDLRQPSRACPMTRSKSQFSQGVSKGEEHSRSTTSWPPELG
jgi:hypothetical protein